MKRRRVLSVGAGVLATGLAGCTGGGASGAEATAQESPLVILDHELVHGASGTSVDSVWVRGHAKNVTGQTLSYAEIAVDFYDEDGEELKGFRDSLPFVESFIDNVSDLGPDEVWEFEVGYTGTAQFTKRVADYEVRVTRTY